MPSVLVVLVGAVFSVLLAGCGGELDPSEPEGAYYLFRDALLAGDAEAVWQRTDEETHQYFQERYEELVEMDETIERYLPQADHKIARQQSGTVLLTEVDNGKALFMRVFQPENLPQKEAVEIGTDISEIQLAEDDSAAKLITRAGQEFVLTRDEDDQWRVMLSNSSPALDQAFGWLNDNQAALQQTVEELIAEEREKREQIIAELMNKKDE